MRHHKYLLIGGAALLCSCAFEVQDRESADEETGSQSAAMVMGLPVYDNALGVVAIYHVMFGNNQYFWLGRPCSGIYVGERGGKHWVLTARHCVTFDGEPLGPLVPDYLLRVTAKTDTGPTTWEAIRAATEPEAVFGDAPIITGTDARGDIAMLRLPAAPADLATDLSRFGFYFGWNTSDFVTTWDYIHAFGYGQYVKNANSTSGILRDAWSFPLVDVDRDNPLVSVGDDQYRFLNNGGGTHAKIMHGDSGGPSFIYYQVNMTLHNVLTGVHAYNQDTRYEEDYYSHDTIIGYYGDWIQYKLGGVYLSSMSRHQPSHDVAPIWNTERGTFGLQGLPGGEHTDYRRFYYDRWNRRIKWAHPMSYYPMGFCLHVDQYTTREPVLMRPCDGSLNQKWYVSEDLQVHLYANPAACMRMATNGKLHTLSCTGSETRRWLFHPMPSPAP
jgi:hypothetical protein